MIFREIYGEDDTDEGDFESTFDNSQEIEPPWSIEDFCRWKEHVNKKAQP